VALLGLALAVTLMDDGNGLTILAALATAGGLYGALGLLNLLLMIVLAWVGLGVWQQQGRLMHRIAELEAAQGHAMPAPAEVQQRPALAPRSFAPDFRVPALAGGERSLADLLDPTRSTLLLFFDVACGPCDGMLRRVAGWQRSHAGRLRIVPVFSGEEAAVRARTKIHGLEDVLVQRGFEVGEAFGVPGTPGAILLSPEGRVQSPTMAGEESISRLLDAVVTADPQSAAPEDPDAPVVPMRATETARAARRSVGGVPVLQRS
jgi:hypothetical protein